MMLGRDTAPTGAISGRTKQFNRTERSVEKTIN